MTLLPENVKKIAILRANALGDFIVTLPAIRAIRNHYPEAEIVLLGKPWHKGFLEEKESNEKRSSVDRVIVIPVTNGLREELGKKETQQELHDFFNAISKENFDIILNFHGKGIAANPFIKKIGARFTCGLSCPQSEQLDHNINFYYYQPEIIRYLEVALSIGAKPVSLEPEIKLLKKDKAEADCFLNKHGIKDYLIIHPSGTDIRRMWKEEKFAQLTDKLIQEGHQVIFTGSEEENTVVESILSRMKFSAINSTGQLSLGGLTGLLAGAGVVIAVDTGPLHLARAVGAKTVGLYWAGNLLNWGPLTRSNHHPVVAWAMECPHCHIIPNDPYPFEPLTKTCSHKYSFIEDISVEEVLHAVVHFLKAPSKKINT